MMTGRTFLKARGAVSFLLVFGLVACGDSEAQQRKAFIEFLQTRIVAKAGVHVPQLTADEAAAFGDYAKHYAVITDFNAALDRTVSQPLQRALNAGAPRSLAEAVSRRADIAAVTAGLEKLRGALDGQLKIADAAHAALKQPADLKPVFDAAYERDVTRPAKALADVFPDADAGLKSILALADFITAHKDAITLQGSNIQVGDPGLQRQLQAMLDDVRAKNDAIVKAQQRLNAVIRGI